MKRAHLIIMVMSNSKHDFSNTMVVLALFLLPRSGKRERSPLGPQKSHFLRWDILRLVFNAARADTIGVL